MMKTTDYKTSKQLAAALEGAGYVFETYFAFWAYKVTFKGIEKSGIRLIAVEYYDANMISDNTPAFTMGQLWEMLPSCIDYENESYSFVIDIDSVSFSIAYSDFSAHGAWFEIKDTNPCNALARLAIWCIEKGHLLNLEKK